MTASSPQTPPSTLPTTSDPAPAATPDPASLATQDPTPTKTPNAETTAAPPGASASVAPPTPTAAADAPLGVAPPLSPSLSSAFAQLPMPAADATTAPVSDVHDAPPAAGNAAVLPAAPPLAADTAATPSPASPRRASAAQPHELAPGRGAGAPSAPSGRRPALATDDDLTREREQAAKALRIADILQPVQIETVLPDERAALDQIDVERRLRLLRIIAPGLLVVIILALPFAIQADMAAHTFASVPQLMIGLAGAVPATWGAFRRRVSVATLSFFLGVSGVVLLLILQDGLLGSGQFTLLSVLDFAELVIPIAVAGVLGSPRLVLVATGGAVVFTLGVLLLTPHDPTLTTALQQPGGLAVFTIPLSTVIVLGLLLYAATSGYRRTQRELGAFRIAYSRERELDRLKNQFISNVNHELRTPIMALQGYIELARVFGQRQAITSQEQMLARGGETTSYLAGLVRAILNVRRIEDDAANIKPELFALREVILSATNLLDPRAADERQRDLYLHAPADLLVFADPDRVRQVMVNLLSNASKYSPEGSPIEITARILPAQSPRGARTRGAQVAPMVEVAVRDYGLGIPPEQAVLLFQRFVRLERDIASNVLGSGLGLAICRAYIEAMGGRIWVESSGASGDGSTFRFTLPLGQA